MGELMMGIIGIVVGLLGIAFIVFITIALVKAIFKWENWAKKRIVRKQLLQIEENEAYLKSIGFNPTKSLMLMDCYPKNPWDKLGNMLPNGFLVDYNSKRFAVSPSWHDPSMHVFNFADLRDYEVIEGTKTIYTGSGVGYGPLILTSGSVKDLSNELSIRMVIGGNDGARSVTLVVYSFADGSDNTLLRQNVNSQYYQVRLELARSIADELGNIMHMNTKQSSG